MTPSPLALDLLVARGQRGFVIEGITSKWWQPILIILSRYGALVGCLTGKSVMVFQS